jgi:hypothetical protein
MCYKISLVRITSRHAIFRALAREADLEWPMIDSTIVRAHQQAAGARRKKGGRMPKSLAAPEGV